MSSSPGASMDYEKLPPAKRSPVRGSIKFKTIVLEDLPMLRDEPMAGREALFLKKLHLCSNIFDFYDNERNVGARDKKRQTLLELVDYVNSPAGQKIFTENTMPSVVNMVRVNIVRALPSCSDDFDPEEDEPNLEPSWPHLQVVYEFFLRFVVSGEVNAKQAKKFVDQSLCLAVIELFDSEDPRERDYLKTILHRIYGKFMTYRSYIRKAISNVFYSFVYEEECKRHNGVGELLEILGSIINGFAIPLKPEHVQFLKRALIPLHKSESLALYQQQLSYCVVQYVEKDPDTAVEIVRGLIKYWPWLNSGKQVIMVNELEEILEFVGYEQLMVIKDELWQLFKAQIGSTHFQVAERILFLWNNEHLVNSGCLSRQLSDTLFPAIYPELKEKMEHWNPTVAKLAQSVEKMFQEFDAAAYEKVIADGGVVQSTEVEDMEREGNWAVVKAAAAANRK